MMRVLYLVISSNEEPWRSIRVNGQAKTWFNKVNESNSVYIEVFGNGSLGPSSPIRSDFHRSDESENHHLSIIADPERVDEHSWIFNSRTGWDAILTNTTAALHYALKNVEFDFVIRTVASSYWNVDATEKLLSKFEAKELYLGNVTNNLATRYVEGDGIILSRDLADLLVRNYHLLQENVIDDVAIGRAFRDLGIRATHLGRPWVRSFFDIRSPTLVPIDQIHTFRCKYEFAKFGITRRRDAKLMRILHKILN